jgi:hypothetical protein
VPRVIDSSSCGVQSNSKVQTMRRYSSLRYRHNEMIIINALKVAC